MRINARLDEHRSRKLQSIMRATGSTMTQVLKAAIDQYFDVFQSELGSSLEVLESAGFVGCGVGQEDLSDTYKVGLSASLQAKHGHR